METKLSYEYIRGLIDGEGSFTFSTNEYTNRFGKTIRRKVPAFILSMHERDTDLIKMVRDTMGLKNKIYFRRERRMPEGYISGRQAILIVREFGNLKNIIIPFFYKRLRGYKKKQFEEWIEAIGNDPGISNLFRLLYKLHATGFYDRNPKFLD